MKEKKDLPVWAIVGSLAAVGVIVIAVFVKGANTDASADELAKIRNNQRSFASGSLPGASGANRDGAPLGGPGAPAGAVVDPTQPH